MSWLDQVKSTSKRQFDLAYADRQTDYIKSYCFIYLIIGQSMYTLGMVTALDAAVGNITAILKNYGLYSNSIILFTTDVRLKIS